MAALLASEAPWSPEARFSLDLLAAELAGSPERPAPPPDLDPSEKERRKIWRKQRPLRPDADN